MLTDKERAELAWLRAEVARIPGIEKGWRDTNRECIKHWNRADKAEATLDRVQALAEQYAGRLLGASLLLAALHGPAPADPDESEKTTC